MAEDDPSRDRAQHLAEMARMAQALPFDERSRLKAENVRDILVQRALELERAKDASPEKRERLAASRDLVNIRVEELPEHFAGVVPAFQRARLLRCLGDALVGTHRIGTGGATNEAVERALREAQEQTAPGRGARSRKTRARRELLRPHVLKVLADCPTCNAAEVIKILTRLPSADRPKELYTVGRTQTKVDVQAIIDELCEAWPDSLFE